MQVLEMYGFTISSFITGIPPATLHVKMMAQPPWDNDVPWGPSFYILHYTYGMVSHHLQSSPAANTAMHAKYPTAK